MKILFAVAILLIGSLDVAPTSVVYLPLIANEVPATAIATATITPTDTETPQPTATEPQPPTDTATPQPTATATQTAGVCLCDSDRYNCSSFNTQAAAQACFNFCVSVGAGDIHRLDQDNNGVACESLPLWVQVWK